MNNEKNIINLIFDPGKGSVAQSGREAVSGEPYGSLPKPTRAGYRFEGWFLGEMQITPGTVVDSESDVRLLAHWVREKTKTRKASMIRRQKIALLALAIAAALLSVTLVIVLDLISIYSLTDTYVVDGVEYSDTYTVKKHGGIYKLFDSDGNLMDRNVEEEDNVYIAEKSGNQYLINEETGEFSLITVVDTEDFEAAPGTRLLMYPQILSTDIQSVKVTFADGTSYRFLNEGEGVYIEGFRESLIEYDQDLYARLCSACGYTLVSMKLSATAEGSTVPTLPDGSIDYAVYGLDEPQASFTVSAIKDKSAKKYEADPKKTYTVYIGDRTLSATGYYVKISNTDTVYILSSTFFDEAVLRPVQELVVPRVTYPVTVNEHTMVQDFFLTQLDAWMEGGETKGNPVVAFDYEEMEYRENTILTTSPFICDSNLFDGMEGYMINDGKASEALSALFSIDYIGCRAIGLTSEKLAEFGLDKNVFYLTYKTKTTQRDEDGNILYATNEMLIGEKTKDGTHYVASFPHDMIVEVDQYYLSFLEWGHFEWYNQYFMSADISYLREFGLDFGDGNTYTFKLDNTMTYAYYKRWANSEQTKAEYVKYQMKPNDTITIDENGYYWYTSEGQEPRRVAVINFNEARRVSHYEAQTTYAGYGNLLYKQDMFYYYDANKKIVRITPDYGRGDTVTERNGEYYYKHKELGTEIKVQKTEGELMYRFEKGHETAIQIASTNLLLFCDRYSATENGWMNYNAEHIYVNDSGVQTTDTFTAVENFRNYYMQFLRYSLRGDIDEEEFVRNMGMTPSEYLASGAAPTATFHAVMEDYAAALNNSYKYDKDGNAHKVHEENITQNLVFRFYRYSDMKAMLTVEVLVKNENGEWVSEGEPPIGKFFVSASLLDKLESDAAKLLAGEYIDRESGH